MIPYNIIESIVDDKAIIWLRGLCYIFDQALRSSYLAVRSSDLPVNSCAFKKATP